MRLRQIRRCAVLLAAAAILISPNRIFSCGPFLTVTLFSLPDRPDSDANFARGQLGILRSTFARKYLFAAYRTLSGTPLGEAEQAAWTPFGPGGPAYADPEQAVKGWVSARARIAGDVTVSISPYAPDQGPQFNAYGHYLNCPADAFQNAVRTLEDRLVRFGANSADIKEWLYGQDQVFSNCDSKLQLVPARLGANTNPLLRADRDYQIAAAHFYMGKYDDAHTEFARVAADSHSPWNGVAAYLAARCIIRKATVDLADKAPERATALATAEKELQAVLSDPSHAAVHPAARRMLGFVEYRLRPAARTGELARSLTRGGENPDFALQLRDYLWLLRDYSADDDLSAWMQLVQQGQRDARKTDLDRFHDALDHWRKQKTGAWLIASLLAAPDGTTETEELLAAIRRVPPAAPAYLTTRYHMARLLLAQKRNAAARTLLDEVLASPVLKDVPSSRNLFLEQRELVARDLSEFLKFAQREPVAIGSDLSGDGDVAASGDVRIPGPMFEVDSASTLNERLPLSDLLQAVEGDRLAARPRRLLATAAWVRAAILHAPEADALATQLTAVDPSLAADLKSYLDAGSPDAKHFAAVLSILRHPGMRPFVDAGVGRTSYQFDNGEEPLGRLDDLRDNWWCPDLGARVGDPLHAWHWADLNQNDKPPASPPSPAFLTAEERAAAAREWKQVSQIGTAPNYLAAEVVRWARAHPDDPRNAEALHLAVRSTRYGCTDKQTTSFSKAAFEFLHSHYETSEWAKKTPYYF